MRTALVTVTVLGIILISQVSARPEAAPAQSRGRADFQGYWMGMDPVDGGDARRSLILRSDGKYSLAARDSMLTLCDSTDRGYASFDDGTVVGRNCDAVEFADNQVLQQRRDGPAASPIRAGRAAA